MQENKIKIGDLISMQDGTSKLEGVVMPHTASNEADVIVIKLKNGYNTGINPFTYKIKKLESKDFDISFQKAPIKEKKHLPNISLIYTGGTIGSRVDYRSGGVHMLIKPQELLYEVPELGDIANISISNLYSIASEDMSYLEWQGIAREAYKELKAGSRGIVITHGTDTMHYSAAALSFMLPNLNAPIIITGAQRSPDRGSSDAFMNLICATKFASQSDIAEVGVCMHTSSSDDYCGYIRGTKVRKMHTSRRDAFLPINSEFLAKTTSDKEIEYNTHYKKMDVTKGADDLMLKDKFEEKVGIIKAHPNQDPQIVDYYVQKKYKGIILEGSGLGHLPVSTKHQKFNWLKSIKDAIDAGLVIGMSSQCINGRVNPYVYTNLRLISGAGVIYCEDMHPETAYVKLGWLIGNYGVEKAAQLLNINLVGEISSRTEFYPYNQHQNE